jgi:hypothetical protein
LLEKVILKIAPRAAQFLFPIWVSVRHPQWAFAVLTDPERIEEHSRRANLWLLKNLKTNPALASLKTPLESARCYSRDEFVLRCSLRL